MINFARCQINREKKLSSITEASRKIEAVTPRACIKATTVKKVNKLQHNGKVLAAQNVNVIRGTLPLSKNKLVHA